MMKTVLFSSCFLAFALSASAHMGLTPPEAVAGERAIVSLRIGHDCGDDTVGTTNFTVLLPPRLGSVRVEQTANWRVFIHKVKANPPVDTGHGQADEYVRAVTYIGFLPDGHYQLFNLRIQIPDTVGKTLWFSGYQDCHNQGTSLAWDTIPSKKNPDPRYPARPILISAPPPENETAVRATAF